MKLQIYGDSLMKGVVVDEKFKYHATAAHFLEKLQEETGIETVNRARFGSTVEKGSAILQKDLEKGLDCQVALLEFGGNDCDFDWAAIAAAPEEEHQPHTPLQAFLRSMEAMVQSLRTQNVQPILMTLPPLQSQRYLNFIGRQGSDVSAILRWLKQPDAIYRYQEMYSSALLRLADRLNLPIVDVRTRFLLRRDCDSLIAIDGIHMTEAGYSLIYDTFREAIVMHG